MRRKINVTAAEMLTLREEGLSNHDIAKSLDISVHTVRRYIGAQGCRMENLKAFADDPQKKTKTEVKEMATVTPRYNPKPIEESYRIGDMRITLANADREMIVRSPHGSVASVPYDAIPGLVEFLAWAMRERMEAIPDEVRES